MSKKKIIIILCFFITISLIVTFYMVGNGKNACKPPETLSILTNGEKICTNPIPDDQPKT